MTLVFTPQNADENTETVVLSIDEFEVLKLIDREGHSQEDCSAQMGVSRTTVQKIYESARYKLSCALVEGLSLAIDGGDYTLCGGDSRYCKNPLCPKKEIRKEFQILKGENIMRIAVTYENGNVFQHFGHTEYFKVYDVKDNAVTASEVVSTNGQGHGALADVLKALSVDVLICGGIGAGAQMALAKMDIKLYGGVSGSADGAVKAFLNGKLDYDPNVKCDRHEHGESHNCGDHSCGNQ